MSVVSYIFGIVSALVVLIVVFDMLRRRRLRERHAVWWVVAGVLALIIGVFPSTLEAAAGLLGITVPTNLVFFVSIGILFFVCLQHAAEITRLESHARDLAERVALLELRLGQVERPADAAIQPAVQEAVPLTDRPARAARAARDSSR